MLGDTPLPWVNAWQHLGNELNTKDLSRPFNSNLNEDVHNKRRKFIGKCHSLKQEFGFLSPDMFFDIVNIYATSFYGSNLWLFNSPSTEKLFTSWNTMIRLVWNLPNTTHRYFIEEISEAQHLKASLYKRYLNFVKCLLKSDKKCLSALAHRVCQDQGSITRHNLNQIENESNCQDILSLDANFVSLNVKYAPVPDEERWRISLLKELIGMRNSEFFLEDDQLKEDEIEDLIVFVATS